MPDPSGYDNKDDFVSACIKQRQDEHHSESNDQSVAICSSMWDEKDCEPKKPEKSADTTPYGDVEYADPGFQSDGKKRYPIDTEEHIRAAWSYINQTANQTAYTSEQIAHIKNKIIAAWKKHIDAAGPPSASKTVSVLHKTFVTRSGDSVISDGALDFVLSDATPDRYGDVIDANGWILDNFKKNPIALFNHNPDFPVGRWENLGIKSDALRGHLRMAPAGISERIDELRALINAGILRAVSVGFMPIESRARSRTERGELYTKQELVETSLVSVPANPNAVLTAKQLRISDNTMNVVFGKNAVETMIDRDAGNYATWKGEKVLVKRHVIGEWRGQKIYSSE